MSERAEPAERTRSHRIRPVVERDPDEPHRAAMPLELRFDLSFGVASSMAQRGLLVATGRTGSTFTRTNR
ncbi:hypothetical protein DFR69_11159 [Nocardia neocaledoniensis]|uniref:Uncharacterized protein n=2 Tax=Nocardia neocaledoniensis TaxID=236511 RepID=A0A317N7F7_9NOCA|nr:hypothetical protein DFR69_11159 [Nocardia neocaledoniensis]